MIPGYLLRSKVYLKPIAPYSYGSLGFLVVFFLMDVILRIVFNLTFITWSFVLKAICATQ